MLPLLADSDLPYPATKTHPLQKRSSFYKNAAFLVARSLPKATPLKAGGVRAKDETCLVFLPSAGRITAGKIENQW